MYSIQVCSTPAPHPSCFIRCLKPPWGRRCDGSWSEPMRLKVAGSQLMMLSWRQAQHSHHVIQQVLNHLDTHSKDTPRVRAGIVQVLLETVAIAAKGSVGEFHT